MIAAPAPQIEMPASWVEGFRLSLVKSNSGSDYKPLPWQVEPWSDESPRILLTGSAGGGKSSLAANKLHAALRKYPGAMGLMLRKTRESMTNSTVLFYKESVIKGDPTVHFVPSAHRFEYDNGSILAYGGMKDEAQREQVRSIGQAGGLDFVWVEEANKLSESDFNELLPRMRGMAAPYRQLMMSTNPDGPMHWIKRRCIDKLEAKVYYSSAVDNPYNPDDYQDTLKLLTGVQALRLVEGKWVQSEGAIYDNWTDANISAEAVYDPALPVIWAVDDGYKNPRCILLVQERSDGTIVIFREYYKTNQLPDTSINDVLSWGYPSPEFVIYDPAAVQFAALLWSKGVQTIPANNDVSEGIKAVRSYIKDGNGVVSLLVNPECVNLTGEMSTYQWDSATVVKGGDPRPVKEYDHAADACRYAIATNHAMRVPRKGMVAA